ncbi:MAG TPA: sigma-70 family RNA polymerase sigma factor [Solirubrobacteraceae bacterium]
MAPSGSTQVRNRPWWRSSRRGGAPGRCAPRDRDRGRDATAELALVSDAQRGGPREREALVNAYQPLIASVANAYRRSTSVDREELTQEGVVGLLRALERYEPARGVPFWGYAAWWVRQAMQQVVSELSRPMVLSDRALRQLARIKAAQRRFEQARRREATTAELSTIVGLPQSQVEKLLCTERTARGLDEPTGAEAGDGNTVGELLADPPAREAYERVPQQVLAAQVPGLLDHLSDRERTVICSRYGLGQREQTLREVAPRLGVSAERVRQIEQESLAKLHAAVAPDEPRCPPEYAPPGARGCAQA